MLELITFYTACFTYILRTAFFASGAKKGRVNFNFDSNNTELPITTIIVPARDEEKNIDRCLRALTKSQYPTDKFEIIVVDDRSSDKTSSIVRKWESKFPNIKLIQIKNDESKVIPGKPGALDFGIKHAEGEYLLFTDADCKVNKHWIRSIVDTFQKTGADLVCSFTLVAHKNLFDKYQAVEWLFTHTMASGGVSYHQPLGCYGNNMSIKRAVYDEIGGYSNIEFSVTEDLALQQEIARRGKKYVYICSKKSTVRTKPLESLKEYFKQRQRWAIGGQKLGWRATIFVLTSLLIWLTVLLSLFNGFYTLAIISILVKLFGDFAVVYPTYRHVREKKLGKYIFPSLIIFFITELIVPFLLLKRKVEWKGQIFK